MDFFIRIVVFRINGFFFSPKKHFFYGYEMLLIFFDTDKSN